MRREFAITLYLFVFKLMFRLSSLFPLQAKTTFVMSFDGNIPDTIEALERLDDSEQIVILKTANCTIDLTNHADKTLLTFETMNPVQLFKSIYHLATSRHVIIDNYYGFLAVTDFKEEVKCVQLWHAAGAIKQFGLEDQTNQFRTEKARNRFRAVYNRFDHVTVGSEHMVDIYKRSFGLFDDERYLRTGIPRTDFFFDDIEKHKAMNRLRTDFPITNEKKVLLYAPTYRDDEIESTTLQMDFNKMYEHFKYDYVLFLRLHPAVNNDFENKYPGFIYNVSDYDSINTLLLGTDILITDYSSIPFEFALLNKPMIFYAYDLEEYADKRGVWSDYVDNVPGPVAKSTKDVIQIITDKAFQLEKVHKFAQEWNEYSTGDSARNLIQALYGISVEEQVKQLREHV